MSKQTYLQPSESLPDETTCRDSKVLPNLIADAVANAVIQALGRHAAEQKTLGAVADELLREMLELKNCNVAQKHALDEQKHLLDNAVRALAEQNDLLQTIWRHAQSVGGQDLPMREPESKHSDGDAAASAKPAQLGNWEEVMERHRQSAPAFLSTALVELQDRTTMQLLSTLEDNNIAKETSQESYAMGAAVSQGQQTREPFDLEDSDDALTRDRPAQKETTQGEDEEPNKVHKDEKNPEKTWTKLTRAIQCDDEPQVRRLIKARADPNSKYVMTAETNNCFYESPGAVHAVKNNNVSMLKLLLEQKATLQGKTGNYRIGKSDDAKPVTLATHSLLWHACKFGKMDAVKFLLDQCGDDLELKVYDCRAHEGNEWNTPLHQAVVGGHCDVVKLLLNKRAQLAQESMKAAIFNGSFECADVCGILVKTGSANIFEGPMGKRLFDYMYNHEHRNVAILAAVADALTSDSKKVDNLVQKMQEQDLISFMRTPGCEAIFDAIFRPRQLKDWRSKYLLSLNGCKIHDKMININVAEGLDADDIRNRSIEAESKNERFWMELQNKKFLQKLMPGAQDGDLGDHLKVQTRQCLMPNIHNSEKILWELIHGPNAEVALAGKPGAQALVTYCWQREIFLYRVDLAVHLLQAIIFLVFSYMIGRNVPASWRYLLGSASNLLWLRHLYCLVVCWIGVWKLEESGLGSVLKFGAAYDLLRLLLVGFGNTMIFGAEEFNVDEVMEIRITLGVLTFVLWTKVLYAQRGLSYSICMLPILAAMRSIWQFLLVMSWPSVGVANCYYLLNAYSEVFKVVTIVYRMTFLGDFDVEELENIAPTYHPESDGIIHVEDPVITKYHVAFVLFMFVFTMFFTIIMMNLLVGILYDAYSKALEDHQANCLKARASIVFYHLARRKGSAYLRQRFCCGGRNVAVVPDSGACKAEVPGRNLLATYEKKDKYLWFCHPAQSSGDSQDDAVEPNSYLMHSLRDDVTQIKESLKNNATGLQSSSRQDTPCEKGPRRSQ